MDQQTPRPTAERLFSFPPEATKVPGDMHFYLRIYAKAGNTEAASLALEPSLPESLAMGIPLMMTGFLYLGRSDLYMQDGKPVYITPANYTEHAKMLLDMLRDNVPSFDSYVIYAVMGTDDKMIGSMLNGEMDPTARKM